MVSKSRERGSFSSERGFQSLQQHGFFLSKKWFKNLRKEVPLVLKVGFQSLSDTFFFGGLKNGLKFSGKRFLWL